ncbi:Beta-hexosaminidase subunit beta [Hondaea fermentalgiana]|uniref:Beta-hexosaminidase subunit beta n=1 Tax=Hondaea fermentalgiana TaxID=2315210 RepID=A0A2R5G9E6_9STRA|nr:Beta-hexosaminidase subunit beta [Hondaea fermentalgiana]|eukprot:GBG27656.1 Beta-hexosaminidase subunit beta [Hondaea fermentalgiana]
MVVEETRSGEGQSRASAGNQKASSARSSWFGITTLGMLLAVGVASVLLMTTRRLPEDLTISTLTYQDDMILDTNTASFDATKTGTVEENKQPFDPPKTETEDTVESEGNQIPPAPQSDEESVTHSQSGRQQGTETSEPSDTLDSEPAKPAASIAKPSETPQASPQIQAFYVPSPDTKWPFDAKRKSEPSTSLTNNVPLNAPFPLPRSLKFGSKTVLIDAKSLTWSLKRCGGDSVKLRGGENCKDLAQAMDHFKASAFVHEPAKDACKRKSCVSSIAISVDDSNPAINLGTEEAYELRVSSSGIELSATTIFGIMRGLETLSQLVSFNFNAGVYEISNADWFIQDAPQFLHRELLIDSSRHFFPIEYLKQVVVAMAMTKINVLHWHLADDAAFPWCSDAVPELCQKASWSMEERYTRADLTDLVEFARQRGVRVVPELHIPGHTAAWCRGRPDACTKSGTILSPIDGRAEALITTLLQEIRAIFQDTMIHLGGSAVDPKMWNDDPVTASYMSSHQLTAATVFERFMSSAIKTALDLKFRPVVWDDTWEALKPDLGAKAVIVHHRSPTADSQVAAAAEGYNVLFSPTPLWDLSNFESAYAKMLERQPCDRLDTKQCSLALGGGGVVWTERVDGSNLFSIVWSRLGAISERLCPIVLAGMAKVSNAKLCAAVTNAGGLGVIGGAMKTPDQLRQDIAEIKAEIGSSQPFGVDLLLPKVGEGARKTNYDYTKGALGEIVDILCKEKPAMFVSAVGVPPAWAVEKLHEAGVLVANMVGHPKHCKGALEVGCDVLIAQGSEAGGHTGDIATSVLVPQVVDAAQKAISPLTGKPVQVLAAGGIYDGRGLAMALSLGASGVWVGTRFIAAEESGATPMHQQLVLEKGSGDTIRTTLYTGRPLRCVANEFNTDWEENRKEEIKSLQSQGKIVYATLVRGARARGEHFDIARTYPQYVGQGIGGIHKVMPAQEIVEEMMNDACAILQRNAARIVPEAKL